MQRKIDEQLAKETEELDKRMKAKKDEILGDKKRAMEERMRAMRGNLTEFQQEQIMREYEEELSKLERAIRDERERQFELMRRHLLKKQL